MTVSILLVDDHVILRQGLRSLLSSERDFRVVGEANDGLEALACAERWRPDIVVLDLRMAGLNGWETARQIRQRYPATKVVVLSMYAKEAYVLEALRSGAAAYVLKDSTANQLVHAIREALAGRLYLSPPLTERAIEFYYEKTQNNKLDLYETLTPREREILQLTAEGNTSAEIAKRLAISPRTVEVHRAHLMHKLGLENQAELVRYAIRRGIMSVED